MKKRLLQFALLLSITLTFGQAKKPTIMVVPSDVWCHQNGYLKEYEELGGKVKIPDYKDAFQTNADLIQIISLINGMMSERGFPLKNMETVIKSIEYNETEKLLLQSKNRSGIAESPIDQIKRVAKADIIMQLTWSVDLLGPKKKIKYTLQGLDAYTNKQVATATGFGDGSIAGSISQLVAETVVNRMDDFTNTLQDHFDTMFKQGREIIIRIQRWEDWPDDLETEYEDEELGFIIEDWVAENTVSGRFSLTDATENMMFFEQVRIPLENEKGRAIDARRYIRGLSKFLKNAPYNIPNKIFTKGLGEVVIILGSK